MSNIKKVKQEDRNDLCNDVECGLAVSVPPPPPPPLRSGQQGAQLSKHPAPVDLPDPKAEVGKLCHSLINRLNLDINNAFIVSRYHQLQPILQDGPVCGLVALAMAIQMLRKDSTSLDHLIELAKQKGYTKLGEMFSAEAMAVIASLVADCKSTVIDVSSEGAFKTLILHLLHGCPALVPYDADGNHEPCLKTGHKAHWAVISGFAWMTTKQMAIELSSHLEPDSDFPSLIMHLKNLPSQTDNSSHVHSQMQYKLDNISTDIMCNKNFYLFCKQGKSRHTGLWSVIDLLDSNKNLTELDPKIRENIQDYVIPECGIQKGLCNKIVLLKSDL